MNAITKFTYTACAHSSLSDSPFPVRWSGGREYPFVHSLTSVLCHDHGVGLVLDEEGSYKN